MPKESLRLGYVSSALTLCSPWNSTLCEGRTGLSVVECSEQAKLALLVLLAGLLVFDLELKLMVLIKENVASHASI